MTRPIRPADDVLPRPLTVTTGDVSGAEPVSSLSLLAAAILVPVGLLGAFLAYLVVRYAPVIARIFEEKPVFHPPRVDPEPGGEDVSFVTADGLELRGSYFRARTVERVGVVAFCPEFLADRWSFQPYTDGLRDLGFDLLTFDFRNHGTSAIEPGYDPLQWVSDREVLDLRAALAYLRSRPDRDPAGVALFGISRGGSTALCVAAEEPTVWGVVTDGAFPTRGTMRAYIRRWAEIYIVSRTLLWLLPGWVYALVGWAGRMRSSWRLRRRFPDVERAVARIAPRPWLMIHGAKDAYIGPEIARALFALAGEPKDLWIVPGAKHNRCREVEPAAYRERVAAFFRRSSPRRMAPAEIPAAEIREVAVVPTASATLPAGG
jgi:pimeloyl-ACP methyl ester carboxylesterase